MEPTRSEVAGAGPQPHVILLDMMMPRMDGWTFVAQQVKILLSPSFQWWSCRRRHANFAGVRAVAILQKPLNFDDLLMVVRTHC